MKKESFFILSLIFFFLLNQLIFAVNTSLIEENSNVLEVKTYPLKSNYKLECEPIKEDQIKIKIEGMAFDRHKLNLNYILKGEVVKENNLTSTSWLIPNQTNTIIYNHTNLSRGYVYEYKLEVVYESPNLTSEILTTTCRTLPLVYLPQPSDFEVYPVSPSILHLTWKDNVTSTLDYGFCLKRIRLTPLRPENVNINSNTVSWINNSNLNNIGPFYHKLILSFDDNTINDNDQKVGFDGNVASSTSPSSNFIQFSYVANKEIKAARIWSCSFVKLDVNFDGVEDEICSEAVEVGTNIVPTYKLKNNFLANIFEVFNNLFFRLKGFYQLIVEKIKAQDYIDILSYFNSNKAVDLTNNLSNNGLLGVYQDKNLDTNIAYYYRLSIAPLNNGVLDCKNQYGYVYQGGKTTKLNNEIKSIRLCTQNSLCQSFNAYQLRGGDELKDQCQVNADCKNVGSSRRIYQELNR